MRRARSGLRLSGLGLAGLAFLLTRLIVAETMEIQVEAFVTAGIVPLTAGLGLTVFGVALAVGAVSHDYSRTVWTWSVIGAFSMVLVLAFTALHLVLIGRDLELLRESSALVANVLIGGTILGAIVGDRAARHRRTNEQLVQYAERAMLVNRVLRHEILNAVAIVKGYAGSQAEDDTEGRTATEAIRESAEQIERTVEEVGTFAGTTGDLEPVDLGRVVRSVVENPPAQGDVSIVGDVPENALVRADKRLELLVSELVENGLEHGEGTGTVTVSLTANTHSIDITVRDDGPGLPEIARDVLDSPSLPEYDDPTRGYGLQMVRLLVEHYDGGIHVGEEDEEDGAAITVTLQRTRERDAPPLALGVPTGDLYRVTVAALLAGAAMGAVMQGLTGAMPVIGALYGVENAIVGWITHSFHSVVFGLLFAAGCTLPRVQQVSETDRGLVAIGVVWGLLLWLVAAGVIMPIWLAGVGMNATIPRLSVVGLVGHLVWGLTLGGFYAVLPGPTEIRERFEDAADVAESS